MTETKFWKPGGSKPKATKAKSAGKSSLKIEKGNAHKVSKGGATMVLAKAADPAAASPVLSKSVMSMKFMKRKEDDSAELAAEADKRSRLLEGSAKWDGHAKDASSSSAIAGKGSSVPVSDSAEDTLHHMQKLNASQSVSKEMVLQHRASEAGASASEDGLHCTYERSSLWTALPGRRSFGGFNKVIERWHSSVMDSRRQDAKYESEDKDASKRAMALDDEDMLKKYDKLVSLPRGPSMGNKPKNTHAGNGKNKKTGGSGKAGAGGRR